MNNKKVGVVMKEMKERLKEIRHENNMSQKKFADKVGLSQTHLSSLEVGTRNITRRNAVDICEAFNINLEWFISGKGEKYKNIVDKFVIDDPEVKEFVELYVKADNETKYLIKKLIEKTLNENKKE